MRKKRRLMKESISEGRSNKKMVMSGQLHDKYLMLPCN